MSFVYSYKGLNFNPAVSLSEAIAQFKKACEEGNPACLVHKAADAKRSAAFVAALPAYPLAARLEDDK